jgi:hypothetical protein
MDTASHVVATVDLASLEATPAQDISRYQGYRLESSLGSVIAASGARAADVRTLHARPVAIRELEWRAPFIDAGTALADPAREIVFTFYNDALYQIIVSYDRQRTEGLTNSDIIASVSSVYGMPASTSGGTQTSPPPEALPDSVVLARWENSASMLTLVRRAYAPEFQLILTSTPLITRARTAIATASVWMWSSHHTA